MSLSPNSRILLVRTSALGDVIHCLPVLRALRSRYPKAEIGWVVEAGFAPLLDRDPDLDRVFEVKTKSWRRIREAATTSKEVPEAIRAIRDFSADVVLDLMGNHKGGAIAKLSGVKRRIGLARAHRREPSSAVWINEEVEPTGVHSVDRALSMAVAVGAAATAPDFGPKKLRCAAEGSSAPADAPYLVIHPGAAWPNKRYEPQRWGQVASSLHATTGMHVLISAGPGEEGLGSQVVEASEGAAQMADDRSLRDLVALLDGAALVLSGDTGPLHLAHALGRPVVAVMGPTDPATHGPYGAPERAVWNQLPCSFCHRRFDEIKPCLIDLAPLEVIERAREVLEGLNGI
jgi:heptosyltransferase-1